MLKTKLSKITPLLLLAALAWTFTSSTQAAEKELVDYRLPKWKRKHMHDTKKADMLVETLKKLGCEVKKHAHGNHFDVAYRCPEWRRITLDSHSTAHRWESWLKSVGFETRHQH